MKERIMQLLKDEKLSATRFADKIGVQRSSISHIISGRNKPSFDFISKTLEKFPDINAEWLINGKGSMYKNNIKDGKGLEKDTELFEKRSVNDSINEVSRTETEYDNTMVTNVNNIVKVIVLMEDGTFKEYSRSE